MAAVPVSTIAALVVTAFGGPRLRACLHSLAAQRRPPDRVLVAIARPTGVALDPGVASVRTAQAEGFAPTANLGLQALGPGCAVLLLNDDTVCDPELVARLGAAAEAQGEGIYQPRILLDDGSGQVDNTGHRLFFDGFNLARERGLPAAEGRAPPCGELGAFSGAAALLTPELLRETGGFDADFGAFGEDLDLSLRARRLGYRVRFVEGALVHHALGASYGRGGLTKSYWVERNRLRAAMRSLPTSALITMPLWTTARLTALGLSAALGRGIGAQAGPLGAIGALAGGAAGLLDLPGAWAKRRADQPGWRAQDREMWGHLLRHHVRPEDLLRRPAGRPA
jgi:GT2 family glycosyltransferase